MSDEGVPVLVLDSGDGGQGLAAAAAAAGVPFLAATSFSEALSRLPPERPSVALLAFDALWPKPQEQLRSLRALTPEARVVVVCAHPLPRSADRLRAIGLIDELLSVAALPSWLREGLRRPRAPGPSPRPDALSISLERHGDATVAVLRGPLNEGADLSALGRLEGPVTLDLGELTRVTSYGLHRWLPAIQALCAKGPVVVERLAYPMALQANLVAGLLGGARVASVMTPFYCPRCRFELLLAVAASELRPGGSLERRCGACQTPLAFDELDAYFDFLRPRG